MPLDTPAATPSTRIARTCAAIGAVVVVASSVPAALSGGGGSSLLPLLLFVLWGLVPYGALVAVGRAIRWPWAIAGAGAAAIAAEIGIRLAVFVFPRGSTAAIALVFSPAFLLAVCMPAGGLAGTLVGRAMASRQWWLRGLAVVLSALSLGLVTLGLARPDLFPTTVVARRQTLERLGPIGIRRGAADFEKIPVHPVAAWHLTGEFDGEPGDEIAIVDRGAVQLLDPRTFAVKQQLALAGETARWNWFATLARRGGQLVRVDVGGGFQETRLRALDGTLLWDYHPDAKLPPTALRAADLDADGEAEYYATSQDRLVRLDRDGREVWRQPLVNGSIATVAQPAETFPGWIVTSNSGETVALWDKDGHPLATLKTGDGGYRPVLGALAWIDRRVLALGGAALTLRTPDGATVFEWTVDDMAVAAAEVVRLAPGEAPALAIVAAADRDTHRYRLQIVGADRTLRYDEVLDTMPTLTTATLADGGSTILLGGTPLQALRRRAAAPPPPASTGATGG